MYVFVVSTVVILAIALAVMITAVAGRRRTGTTSGPRATLERVARHLNGEAEPPAPLARVAERAIPVEWLERRRREMV